MAGVHKRKGKWWVRWAEAGRSRSITVGTERQAYRLKVEIEDALERFGRYEPRRAGKSTPLRLIATDYIRASARNHAANTTRRYAQMLELFLRWVGADSPAMVLTYTLLGDYHTHLESPETGRHLHRRSAETCRKHLQAIELLWKWAWQRQARGDYVGVPQPDSLGLRRQPPPHKLAPTWAHMDAMIGASKGWLQKLYLVLRSTGLRVDSQAMQLTWEDVDLDQCRLRIRPELGKSRSERRGRWVPMAPWLAEELAGWGVRDGFLIPCPRKKRKARARDAQRAWRRAGVPPERWTQAQHCFRAGFQSELKRAGADDEAVKFLVGHSLGLRDHYVSPEALPLEETVAMIPPLGGWRDVIALPERAASSGTLVVQPISTIED